MALLALPLHAVVEYMDAEGRFYPEGSQPPGAVRVKVEDGNTASGTPASATKPASPAPEEKATLASHPPAFHTEAAIRPAYRTGFEAGIAGGVDFFESGDFKFKTTNGVGLLGDTSYKFGQDGQPGPFVDLSLGYTFAGFDGKTRPDGEGAWQLLPALQLDYFNFNYHSEGQSAIPWSSHFGLPGTAQLIQHITVNGITLSPILRMQVGAFRPYVGAGLGVGLVSDSGTQLRMAYGTPTSATSYAAGHNSSDTALVFQLMAGTEYFLTPRISLFGEYRFIGVADTEFNALPYSSISMTTVDLMKDNVVSAGVRYHF